MRIPFVNYEIDFTKLAPKKSVIETLKATLVSSKNENARLEGLLDLGPDPDANLTGDQRHSLYRVTGTLGKGTRDFAQSKRDQILKMCHELYAMRGNASNIIELVVDHVVGERLEPAPSKVKRPEKSEDDKSATEAEHPADHKDDDEQSVTQEQIDEVWKDRRNRLHIVHEQMVTDGELEGEAFYIADYHPDTDGHIVLGYFPPENVRKVQKNSFGRDVLLEVDPAVPGDPPKFLYILNSMHDDIRIERHGFGSYTIHDDSEGASPKSRAVHGLCFAKFQGRPSGATRGRPLLMQVLDYIDIHDELIWSATEREKLMRMFILNITDNTIQNKADAESKLREMGLSTPPDAPKVLIHNERIKVELMTAGNMGPIGQTSEEVNAAIYGAMGLPLEYSGRDSEGKSGKNDNGIAGKRMRRKQQGWIDWFSEVLCIMIKLRRLAMSLKGAKVIEIDPSDIKFKHMEVGGKDKSRGAAMIKDLAVSVSTMVNDGLITREAGNELLEHAFEEAGFTISEDNRGLGDSAMDQLKAMQDAGLTPKANQEPPADGNKLTGPVKGGVRSKSSPGDSQKRDAKSVRKGDR